MIPGREVVVTELLSGNAATRQHKKFAGKHNASCCQDDEKMRSSVQLSTQVSAGQSPEVDARHVCRAIVFPYTPILIRYFRMAGRCG